MIIDYVVVSTDNNPFYDGYWELAKKTWKQVVGVKTILVDICDENYHKIYDNYEIIGYKKVESIPTSFQSQVSRLFVTKTYPNKSFLTSDLDMIPLSKSYFIDNADKIDDNSILIYTSDAYGHNNQIRFPICYNLAKGYVYDEILNLNCSFSEFVQRIYTLNFEPLWDSDELYFGKCINIFEDKETNKDRVVKLSRGWGLGALQRADRDYWGHIDYDKVKNGDYIDCHLLRPYESNKIEIDNLLNHLNIN
jgi:hypothetical protein